MYVFIIDKSYGTFGTEACLKSLDEQAHQRSISEIYVIYITIFNYASDIRPTQDNGHIRQVFIECSQSQWNKE